MQSQTKNRLAYLISLTLFFSYVELLIPRIVPFFRLGLSNIVILSAFTMELWPFFLLTVLKSIASSLVSGTLFSPFAIISLAQSVASGLIMYFLFHADKICKKRFLSLYGISITGSSISALIQIFLSSLYLGKGTFSLLGPMLILNTICGILTAFFAQDLKLPELIAENYFFNNNEAENPAQNCQPDKKKLQPVLLIILILTATFSVFFIKNTAVLLSIFVSAFLCQKFCGRKILLLPHFAIWLFIIFTTLLLPEGKVIFDILNIKITQGALISGIQKALRLSAVTAFSQCAAKIQTPEGSLISKALADYKTLTDILYNSKGTLRQRVKSALHMIN